MNRRKPNYVQFILDLLKEIPMGETVIFGETEVFKATAVKRLLKRKHKKGQLLEYKCVTKKIFDPEENAQITGIYITRKSYANRNLSYIA